MQTIRQSGKLAKTVMDFVRSTTPNNARIPSDMQNKLRTKFTEQLEKAQNGSQALSEEAKKSAKAAGRAARNVIKAELNQYKNTVKDTLTTNLSTALKISVGFGAFKGAMNYNTGHRSEEIELLKKDLTQYLTDYFLQIGKDLKQIYDSNYKKELEGPQNKVIGKGKGSQGIISGLGGMAKAREDGSISLSDQALLALKAGAITLTDTPAWLGKASSEIAHDVASALISAAMCTEATAEEKPVSSHVEKLEQKSQAENREGTQSIER
ncbi:hypothetical protein RLOatenuis_8270 [Rickettsiales bacterium]|nr:hypothetical protein RLOatenuis_8270 [Rickettsiales bacterium]